jgi:hypothetical protein
MRLLKPKTTCIRKLNATLVPDGQRFIEIRMAPLVSHVNI